MVCWQHFLVAKSCELGSTSNWCKIGFKIVTLYKNHYTERLLQDINMSLGETHGISCLVGFLWFLSSTWSLHSGPLVEKQKKKKGHHRPTEMSSLGLACVMIVFPSFLFPSCKWNVYLLTVLYCYTKIFFCFFLRLTPLRSFSNFSCLVCFCCNFV